jgi:hypothetical protein
MTEATSGTFHVDETASPISWLAPLKVSIWIGLLCSYTMLHKKHFTDLNHARS